jgi:hypothetical protein
MARRSAPQPPAQPVVPTSREAAKPPSWLRPAILVAAALALMGRFSTASADSDTWWHLKTGQYIVRNHALPVPDPFSFTTYIGAPAYPGEATTRDFNLKHEWLAQAVLYLTYAAAGFPGLVLLRAAMVSAYCGLAGLLVFRRTKSFYRSLASAGLTAFLAGYFLSDRPYQFTYVLLAATLAILEYRRWLWLLPPLFLVWANLHGGFFLGLVVVVVYGFEALFLRWRKQAAPDERRLWLVSAACILAAGLNPNGFLAIPVVAAYRKSYLQSTLFEWSHGPLWPPNPISVLLFTAAAVLVWQRSKTRLVDWLLLGLFGAAYVSAVRNTNLLGLMAPLAIASYVPSYIPWSILPPWSYMPWKRSLPVVAEFVAAGLVLALIGAELAQGRGFHLRAAEWKYPTGAAEFLQAHQITGRIFNSYEKGGFLIWRLWPQERVFIDGRALNESVFRDYQRMIRYAPATGGPSGRALLDQYGIQVIVMNGFEINSGDPYVLPVALADPAEPEWKLVYQDAQATIFMRHPPEGVQPLPSSTIFANLEAQCGAILANDPDRPRCARSLVRLFVRMGDTGRARTWMGTYLQHRTDRNPADDELFRRLGGTAHE